MTQTEILRALVRAEAFSQSERHKQNVFEAKRLHKLGKLTECEAVLAKIPSDDQLLKELVEKLKGKSIFTNIRKLTEGKMNNKYSALKTYFSLGTHIAIECEHNRLEYAPLLESVMQKLFKLI